ncbi:hypothetical protein DIPPA_30139 [Diplonema papillatum]|nr:hypothetical protein DIPPA_30139 [Diplonema papillatum]
MWSKTDAPYMNWFKRCVVSVPTPFAENHEGFTYILDALEFGEATGETSPESLPPPTPVPMDATDSILVWVLLGCGAVLVIAGLVICAVFRWRASSPNTQTNDALVNNDMLQDLPGGQDLELCSYASNDSLQERTRTIVEEGDL